MKVAEQVSVDLQWAYLTLQTAILDGRWGLGEDPHLLLRRYLWRLSGRA